ncbi:MAG: cytochrome c maturation protein CcmE [Chloroflexi bacterium]|nr:cytochrome c maturation protein CcmE [Chloroflexota bacterium]
MSTTLETMDSNPGRSKFLVGGLLILIAVVYLIISSTIAGAQTYYTVDELLARGDSAVGTPMQVLGAVLGDTISYDRDTQTVSFTMVHIPADNDVVDAQGGLAAVLEAAVKDPNRQELQVVHIGIAPDTLEHQAQAIIVGTLREDGVFVASELLFKCPTKYEEVQPEQIDA